MALSHKYLQKTPKKKQVGENSLKLSYECTNQMLKLYYICLFPVKICHFSFTVSLFV